MNNLIGARTNTNPNLGNYKYKQCVNNDYMTLPYNYPKRTTVKQCENVGLGYGAKYIGINLWNDYDKKGMCNFGFPGEIYKQVAVPDNYCLSNQWSQRRANSHNDYYGKKVGRTMFNNPNDPGFTAIYQRGRVGELSGGETVMVILFCIFFLMITGGLMFTRNEA